MEFAYLCRVIRDARHYGWTTLEDAVSPGCPIRNILARLGDKCSLLVIYTLDRAGKEAMRFKELRCEIPGISQKMLAVTLRALAGDGYVTRAVYPEVPQGWKMR